MLGFFIEPLWLSLNLVSGQSHFHQFGSCSTKLFSNTVFFFLLHLPFFGWFDLRLCAHLQPEVTPLSPLFHMSGEHEGMLVHTVSGCPPCFLIKYVYFPWKSPNQGQGRYVSITIPLEGRNVNWLFFKLVTLIFISLGNHLQFKAYFLIPSPKCCCLDST